ncbi:MAG: hypothetical protein IKJ20_02255, partial [Alistipes sp.]|nr:hypothetical protein [Alistipes sp.]
MGLFDIFRRRKEVTNGDIKPQQQTAQQPIQYQRALQFNAEFAELLGGDSFIARSDYKHFISEYQEEYKLFCSINEANILKDYVCKNNLDVSQIEAFIKHYAEIQDLTQESATIKKHNNKFIANHLESEKEYLDNILKACDPAISLDEEQREVVLSNEDHTLVIAGAGAGKTT